MQAVTTVASLTGPHASHRLERVFTACFGQHWRTRLLGGAAEPYYQPAGDTDGVHLLHYRSDFFASALHETAHWCIAGEQRRKLADFGYWYAPDGRSLQQQRAFERAEVKPQALEWLFSLACGYRFHLSADNLAVPEDAVPDSTLFKREILAQARGWQRNGLPRRGAIFFEALAADFGTGLHPQRLDLTLAGLTG